MDEKILDENLQENLQQNLQEKVDEKPEQVMANAGESTGENLDEISAHEDLAAAQSEVTEEQADAVDETKNAESQQSAEPEKESAEQGRADEKFDMSSIEKTFASYKKGQLFDGVVVLKRSDGLIFNIGGKNDAFIARDDFDDYDAVKIGDRFKVRLMSTKNEEGMIEVSKREADDLIIANQNAQKLKLGSKFSFVVTDAGNGGLHSRLGDYQVFIPAGEVSSRYIKDFRALIGKQFEATVTEIDKESKSIVGSIKILTEQIKQTAENLFWSSIFVNKIVSGKIKKIMPYGCFVDVDGVDCFVHISNLTYARISNPSEVVKEGETYNFKVLELDRENKKVALTKKVFEENPRVKAVKELQIGQTYTGQVVKILPFGAIIRLDNGASGLLHISNATTSRQTQIYEVVKLDQKVDVTVIDKNEEEQKISFRLANLANAD